MDDYVANWFGWIVWLLILVLKLFKAWFVLGTGCDLQLDFSLAGIGFFLDRLPSKPWTLQSRARDKPQGIFCQIKFKFGVSAFIVESSACPWLRTLAFPPWPARVAPQAVSWRSPGQFKPRSHLIQPLHKQSVGRWTPEVSDVVEESKLWRREKSETHFGFPKPYFGFWLDMSVSPPSASPLERVQTTRARFVRAKPDPVLRSWRDSASIKSV